MRSMSDPPPRRRANDATRGPSPRGASFEAGSARGASRWLLSALAVWSWAGCGPCGRDRFSRVVAEARTTAGPYRAATVTVSFAPSRARGDGTTRAKVRHALRFEGEGRDTSVVLGENLAPSRESCAPTFTLSFSPDGTIVAFSDDGGRGWRYVGLEGDAPLFDAHRTPTVASTPWRTAPTTKSLALAALLAANDPTTALAHAGRFDWRFGQELEAAARFACAHPSDPELRRALMGSLRRATAWRAYGGGEHDALLPLLLCASDASRGDTELRQEVRSALSAVVRDGAGGALRTYAQGCRGGVEGPGEHPLSCLAREALDLNAREDERSRTTPIPSRAPQGRDLRPGTGTGL